jgi:putative hydrolase of the HAD superfamily
MRKPEPAIFEHVLRLLGVEAGQTVFVDDLEHNVRAAQAIGLVGVHHTTYDATVVALEDLFGVPLGE